MKIKRYFAQDMRKAIQMVRDEQGPDAVILSNKKVAGGIEIIAAEDYDEALMKDKAKSTQPARQPAADFQHVLHDEAGLDDDDAVAVSLSAPRRTSPVQAVPTTPNPDISWSQEPSMVQMRQEINNLRDLLEDQMASLAWGELGRRQPLRAGLLRKLAAMGFSSELANSVVRELPERGDFEAAWQKTLGLLSHRLQTSDDAILAHGGVVALVGATGVGKTTTIAKLAARFALRHGAGSVALITADNFRIGAHEQLRTYARILGMPIRTVSDQAELYSALDSLADKKLVLIDTAGMGHRDERLQDQLAMLSNRQRPIDSYLVLSATHQRASMEQMTNTFEAVPLRGCIITKLDESVNLGTPISIAIEHRLPVAYVSSGQQVPEDLRTARSHQLISRAVTIMQNEGDDCADEQLEHFYGKEVMHAFP